MLRGLRNNMSYYKVQTGYGGKNIIIITKRTDWFMETFMKYKSSVDMVYETCFNPVDPRPFPFENYQRIMGEGPYPGYRKALLILPKYKIAPKYTNIFIFNTEKVRMESMLPRMFTGMSTIFTTYGKKVKDIPEMREVLMKHRYWLRYLRRETWEHDAITADFMFLNGNGYRGVMRIFKYKKPYEEDTELMKDIWLTWYFYNSPRGNFLKRKLLTDELQISTKL